MKKIYSIVLMATVLLISANTWGQTSTVQLVNQTNPSASKGYATLQAAIDAIAPGEYGTITLLEEQNLEAQVVIPNVLGEDNATYTARGPVVGRPLQHITLDLNGNDINGADKKSCIVLVKGELNITGEGTIQKQGSYVTEGSAFNRAAIVVLGAPGNKNEASLDHSKEWWSILTLDENVKLYSGTVKTFGLSIADIGSNFASHTTNPGLGSNGNNIDGASSWLGTREKLGYTTYNQVPGKNKQPQPVTSNYDLMWGRNITSSGAQEQGSAFGVKIIVKGEVYGYSRGINVLGHVNQHPSAFPTLESNNIHKETRKRYEIGNEHPYYYEHYFPWITLTSTAKVHCVDGGITNDEACGIYSSGWAVLDISGEVYGQNGAYLKGGDLKLNDANIYSTSSHGATSGVADTECSGNGIFISTDPAYAHDITVEVNGDSRIAGNGGVAITDVVASVTTTPDVNFITINGGTIEGGSLGAIVVTENTGDKTVAYGGTNITGATTKGGTESSVAASGTYATEVTDPVTNKTTIVISDLGAGNSVETVTENLAQTTEDYVKWTGTADQYILDDKTLEYLEMNPSPAVAQKIYVGDATHQVTLTVDRVVMGSLAQIIVAPGSKLIITGTDGIVAPVFENILLKSTATEQATFLFNPAVSSNKYPKATVELTSKAYKKGENNYAWQRFAVPTHAGYEVKRNDMKYDKTNYPTAIYKRVYSPDGWQVLAPASEEAYVPFLCYNMTTNVDHVGAVYTFQCEMAGNVNAELPLLGEKWSYYGNSYTAPIDLATMIPSLPATVSKTVYVHNVGEDYWDAVNVGDIEDNEMAQTQINPMQAFVYQKRGEGTSTILDYENWVYEPAMAKANPAPARRVSSSVDYQRATIVMTAEDGSQEIAKLYQGARFANTYDDGYDAEKLMSENHFNLYIAAEEGEMTRWATDEIENATINMQTKQATSYTMSFKNVTLEGYAVKDNLTGTTVEIMDGNTYHFSTLANANIEGRFEIVGRQNMPTAIDNTEAVKSVKGIYTITGQYVGEENVWNTLPAGVYVVNGMKMVK